MATFEALYEDDTDFASCPMHLLLYGGLMVMMIIKRGLLNPNGKARQTLYGLA